MVKIPPDGGMSVFFGRGEVSFMDVALDLFSLRRPPCRVYCTTWRIGKRDIEYCAEIFATPGVDAKLLLDVSMQHDSRRGEWEAMRDRIGKNVWVTKNHSKIFAMSPNIVMLTSANMNRNTRLQVFTVIRKKDVFDEVERGRLPYFAGKQAIEHYDRATINAEFEAMDSGVPFDFDMDFELCHGPPRPKRPKYAEFPRRTW